MCLVLGKTEGNTVNLESQQRNIFSLSVEMTTFTICPLGPSTGGEYQAPDQSASLTSADCRIFLELQRLQISQILIFSEKFLGIFPAVFVVQC